MSIRRGNCLKLGISLIIPLCLCGGKIYKYIDEHGRTVYTDKPHLNSEEIIIEPNNPSVSRSQANHQAKESKAVNPNKLYTVTISEPLNGATLSRNQAEKTKVVVEVTPKLEKEHRVSLFVDGGQVGIPQKEFIFEVPALPVGQHQIQAKVLDKNGRPIKNSSSPSVTVFQPKATARGVATPPGYVTPAPKAPQATLAPQDKRTPKSGPLPQVSSTPKPNATPTPSSTPNPNGLPQPPILPMP